MFWENEQLRCRAVDVPVVARASAGRTTAGAELRAPTSDGVRAGREGGRLRRRVGDGEEFDSCMEDTREEEEEGEERVEEAEEEFEEGERLLAVELPLNS